MFFKFIILSLFALLYSESIVFLNLLFFYLSAILYSMHYIFILIIFIFVINVFIFVIFSCFENAIYGGISCCLSMTNTRFPGVILQKILKLTEENY